MKGTYKTWQYGRGSGDHNVPGVQDVYNDSCFSFLKEECANLFAGGKKITEQNLHKFCTIMGKPN